MKTAWCAGCVILYLGAGAVFLNPVDVWDSQAVNNQLHIVISDCSGVAPCFSSSFVMFSCRTAWQVYLLVFLWSGDHVWVLDPFGDILPKSIRQMLDGSCRHIFYCKDFFFIIFLLWSKIKWWYLKTWIICLKDDWDLGDIVLIKEQLKCIEVPSSPLILEE